MLYETSHNFLFVHKHNDVIINIWIKYVFCKFFFSDDSYEWRMIVILAQDHIVISGTNVEQASEQYGKQLSIKAVKVGEHENWGTYNYLAYFSNSCYIEWL